jgi:hypothetical protein
MKKTKRKNVLLLSRGKQKNSLFPVLQQGYSFSPFSRSLCQQLYGNPFWKQKTVNIFIHIEGDAGGLFFDMVFTVSFIWLYM